VLVTPGVPCRGEVIRGGGSEGEGLYSTSHIGGCGGLSSRIGSAKQG